MTTVPIKNFTDLDAWKEGHQLVLMIYKVTDTFPPKEQFGLVSQMCRASVSITSNIAEGFSRFHYSDRCRFYYMARGSVSELQNQIIIVKDLSFINQTAYQKLWDQSERVGSILNGLIRSTTKRLS